MTKRVFLLCLFLSFLSLNAQESDEVLRNKLTNALKFSLNEACFSATARISDYPVKYSRMYDSSGFLFLREDIYDETGKKLTVTLLENKSGFYQIDETVGVLKNEKEEISMGRGGYINYAYNAGGMLTNCRTATYSEQEVTYQGVPCDKITLSLNATPEQLAKWLRWPLDYAQKEENQIIYAEYYIGKTIPFVYAICRYNKNGGKVPGGIEFTDVKLNPKFPEGWFDPPKTPEMKVVKSQKEADQLFAPKKTSWKASWGQRWNRLESMFYANTGVLSWILAIAGAACIATVVGLKLREKYRS